jgi:hypothetical protein
MKRNKQIKKQKPKGKSNYAKKRDYLVKLSRAVGQRVFGFEIPMERKVWRSVR